MIYLKVQENEYPAYISGRLIDRDWDGRASKSITLTMTHAQAAQLFTDGLGWSIVQRETVPDGTDGGGTETVQEWDNADYCVAGPITDHRDGTLTVKMGKYTQLEEALRQIGEALAGRNWKKSCSRRSEPGSRGWTCTRRTSWRRCCRRCGS